jgi:predicted MPP superfamily phosphohydrolase
MRIVIKIALMVNFFIMISCKDMFDYSPYAINFSDENRNVNQRNIEKLHAHENADDTITIALTGDSHRFYDEFDGFVNHVNKNISIDFVIHVGDIADFGLPKQYEWSNSYLLKLNAPYFVVIGNHDLVGNGIEAYQEMFGTLNYSFIYDSLKFIFINTNSREFKFNGNVPDNNWLDNQLRPSSDFTKAVVVFHVPPIDCDFDKSLEEDFHNSLSRYNNVLFTVHGHSHGHEIYYPYADSITYVNIFGVENNKYNLIKITDNNFDVETVEF